MVDGAKKNRIALLVFAVGFGCVEVDEHGAHIRSQDHVGRLDIPVDQRRLEAVEHLQRMAQLEHDVYGVLFT